MEVGQDGQTMGWKWNILGLARLRTGGPLPSLVNGGSVSDNITLDTQKTKPKMAR